ncbi:MAG: hypothetical protein ACK5Q2_14630 [Bacteroidota bacterium]
MMKTDKLWKWAVLLLLLMNTALVVHIVRRPGKPEPRDIIASRLHFDAGQKQAFEALVKIHREAVLAKDMEIRSFKDQMYAQLCQDVPDTAVVNMLQATIASAHRELETIHFNHFMEVKKLCRSEQMSNFNGLTAEISRFFGKPPHPPGR